MPYHHSDITAPNANPDGTALLPIWAKARAVLARTMDGAAATRASIDTPILAAGRGWLSTLSNGASLTDADKVNLVETGKLLFWRHAEAIPTVVQAWSARPRAGLVLQRRGSDVVLRAIGARHLQPLIISPRRSQAVDPGATKAAVIAAELRAAAAPKDGAIDDIPSLLPVQRDWLDAFARAAEGEPLQPPVAEASKDMVADEIVPWITAARLPSDLAQDAHSQLATLHELARDSEAVQTVGLIVSPVAYGSAGKTMPINIPAVSGGEDTLVGHQGDDSLASSELGSRLITNSRR